MNAFSRALVAVTRAGRALVSKAQPMLHGVDDRGWLTLWSSHDRDIHFQTDDIHVRHDHVMANWAVFACITLIASDIGKLCLKLVQKTDGIWIDADSPAFSPVLRKPNRFQTRQKFIEYWIVSKLSHGNAYILMERDQRGVVVAMYVLDPHRVTPLVAPDGSVYYRLQDDDLSGVPEGMPAVPASEIIHDTMVCLFHPLVGISPIYAAGLAAMHGLNIQRNSARFNANMSRPSGILTSENQISDEQALEYKARWEKNYGANNVGKVAVLGGGLKFQGMAVTAVDSQMWEMLKLSAEMVCSTFHLPAFKIGAGTIPAGQKVEDLNQIYYSDCLQSLMEAVEALLDFGLGLDTPKDGKQLGTMFELDDLLKMDSSTLTDVLAKQSGAGLTKIDEARKKLNLPPTAGGDTPYLQQQNYSLQALAKRDASADPFGKAPPPAPDPAPPKSFDEAGFLKSIRDSQQESVVALSKDIAALRERIEEVPDEDLVEQSELDGAKQFADELIRLFTLEPVCG